MQFSTIFIIYNPNSTGDSEKNATKLGSELERLYTKTTVTLLRTERAGHAEELAYNAARKSEKPLIISSSGDGGYFEVVNGVMKAQLEGAHPVCMVLPSGNANDHSRTLQSDDTLEIIKTSTPQQIDLLRVKVKHDDTATERYAHSYVGLGLTPVIAVELNKTSLNALKEPWIVLRTFIHHRPIKIVHKNKLLKLDSIIFANIKEMAKVLTLSTDSKPDDGVFEVVTFTHASKLRLIKKLVKATVSGLETSERHTSYTFTTTKTMPAQIDGEVLKLKRGSVVTINSAHKALTTLL